MAHHEAMEPYYNRAQGYGTVPHQDIVSAGLKVVNNLPPSERAAAQAYAEKTGADWANLEPRKMGSRIDLYNSRDASFYNKGTQGQSAALSQAEQAIDKAQADAARTSLYIHISPEDKGAGPRAIRGQAGNLHELENSALRRTGSIVAEQPLTPFGRKIEPLVAPIKAAWGAVRGNPSTGISYAADSGSRSIPLLKKAFKSVDEPYAALPRPQNQMYPTIPPSRQLGPAPIQLPGPIESANPAQAPSIEPFVTPFGRHAAQEQAIRPAATFVKPSGPSGQPPISKGPVAIPREVNAAEEQALRPAETSVRPFGSGGQPTITKGAVPIPQEVNAAEQQAIRPANTYVRRRK